MTQLKNGLTKPTMDKKLIPTQDALEEYPILVQTSPNREGCFLFFQQYKRQGVKSFKKETRRINNKGDYMK